MSLASINGVVSLGYIYTCVVCPLLSDPCMTQHMLSFMQVLSVIYQRLCEQFHFLYTMCTGAVKSQK